MRGTVSPYFLGGPVWACDAYVGSLFASKNRRTWLRDYSAVFNTVEVNSTFYALPKAETFKQWADETADGFEFACKFPSVITHEKQLVGAERETAEFFERMQILRDANRLAPLMLQLPPFCGGDQLAEIETYLRSLPKEFRYAVEVRHKSFFEQGASEHALNNLLAKLKVDRVLFDSRPLYSAPASDEHEKISQSRKPNLPVRQTVTGTHPMLRFIGRDDLQSLPNWVEQWTAITARWLSEGRTPYVFMHAPNNDLAPLLCEMFHESLRQHIDSLPTLPAWPGRAMQKQTQLF